MTCTRIRVRDHPPHPGRPVALLGHTMLRRAADWSSLVRRFVFGELGVEPLDRFITKAMQEPAPGGLSVPLLPVHQ